MNEDWSEKAIFWALVTPVVAMPAIVAPSFRLLSDNIIFGRILLAAGVVSFVAAGAGLCRVVYCARKARKS